MKKQTLSKKHPAALMSGTTLGVLVAFFSFLGPARAAHPSISKNLPPQNRRLQLKISFPAAVPFGYSQSGGVGVIGSVQAFVTGGLGLEVTSGVINYWDQEGGTERDIPVLLGMSYFFKQVSQRSTPYVGVKAGYTYHESSDETSHWITALVGGGMWIHLKNRWALDVGVDITVPDLRGDFEAGAGLLMRVGIGYDVI